MPNDKVRRYTVSLEYMGKDEYTHYVHADDYAALRAKLDALTADCEAWERYARALDSDALVADHYGDVPSIDEAQLALDEVHRAEATLKQRGLI